MTRIEAVTRLPVGRTSLERMLDPLRFEAMSPPPGGHAEFEAEGGATIILRLGSDEVSTVRAMWNSYMGLVSAAFRTAVREV